MKRKITTEVFVCNNCKQVIKEKIFETIVAQYWDGETEAKVKKTFDFCGTCYFRMFENITPNERL